MKKVSFLLALFIAGIFFSCHKENSCEDCRENKPPIAIAGPDQVVTLPTASVSLDGSASNDPDGTISEWLWTKISGPAFFSIVNSSTAKTIVKDLAMGIYNFELMIKDDKGAFAKDTLVVTVAANPTINHPPVANAGIDQAIALPINSINLDGSASTDPDNNITNYEWTKISGPSSFNIANTGAAQTQVDNLIPGIYLFELKIIDAGGLFSKDTVQVFVMNQQLPCIDCKIAFVSNRDGNDEIYFCNGNSSNIVRLTNNPASDREPTWSPDHSRIAFISDRTGDPELYIMNADGSNVIRKTFSGRYTQNPTWSPDGSKIAYSSVNNGSMNIWVMDLTTGVPTLLFDATGWDGYPAWSPDGMKIAFVSDWAAYDIVYDIYLINADGTGFTTLIGNIFDSDDYLRPSWSPNSTKLALTISKEIEINQYNTRVGVINADGSSLIMIMSGAAAWTRTSWSADGTRIAYTSLSGSRLDVSWVSTDGSSWGTIVTNGWDADWQH